jgi:isoquinoline 1-oxidoreductase beta subunit
MLGVSLSGCDDEIENTAAKNITFTSNIWLKISQNNIVTIIIPDADMGQGVRTSLSMLVAEELEVIWRLIRVEQAKPTPEYGDLVTGGSTSIRSNWERLRQAGAIVREIFIAAAADLWNVPASDCYAEKSSVVHRGSNRRLLYGELIERANEQPIPGSVVLKEPEQFKLIGTSVSNIDDVAKVSGKAVYGIDVHIPGMLVASIIHCPYFGGRLKTLDSTNSMKISGVTAVIEVDSGIAVVADNYWAAKQGVDALDIVWEKGEFFTVDTQELKQRGQTAIDKLDVNLMSDRKDRINVEFEFPYQAHATMEPMNCTAYVHDGVCEIWAPTQNATRAKNLAKFHNSAQVRDLIKKIQRKIGIGSDEDIIVHTTLLGGGFGRRLNQDFVVEAVQISKEIGKPVKLIWSREEDMQHDFYRPFTMHKVYVDIDNNGMPRKWTHLITGSDKNRTIQGANNIPYLIPEPEIRFSQLKSLVPTGSWRSVGNSHNTFVIESIIDQLAIKADIDPIKYRLKLLEHEPRCQKVLDIVAENSGWYKKRNKTTGLGVSLFKGYGSYIALVVEVAIENNAIIIAKVHAAVDCGIAVNPDTVKAQIEGGIVFALTATIKSKITVKEGRVEQSNFHDFPLLTLSETPKIETYIIQSREYPGGIGEVPVPPLAPAVSNAIANLSGIRLRKLPLTYRDLSII